MQEQKTYTEEQLKKIAEHWEKPPHQCTGECNIKTATDSMYGDDITYCTACGWETI